MKVQRYAAHRWPRFYGATAMKFQCDNCWGSKEDPYVPGDPCPKCGGKGWLERSPGEASEKFNDPFQKQGGQYALAREGKKNPA
jgi:DnaJ-class molecular chaperone